jgi:hypothetical protein
MCVCILYVCMPACIYVCMYVCMCLNVLGGVCVCVCVCICSCVTLKKEEFFGAFAKLRKATISFVMSVRLSARNNSAPTGHIFKKFDI